MGYYKIFVGKENTASALVGEIDAKDNSILRGEAKPIPITLGNHLIANITIAWGIRLNNKGEVVKNSRGEIESLSVEDKSYDGQVKFLRWGTKGGTRIMCRYMAGYDSIDKDYQERRLGIPRDAGSDESAEARHFITLRHGENTFDEDLEGPLVQMLKVSHYRRGCEFCNPESDGQEVFYELGVTESTQSDDVALDRKIECLEIVKQTAGDSKAVNILLDVVKGPETDGVNQDSPADVFSLLKKVADQYPDVFHQRVSVFRNQVSGAIEKGKAFKIFDTTKDGMIVYGKDKKEKFEDVPGKGDEMLNELFENCLRPGYYETVNNIKSITDKLGNNGKSN